MTMQYIRDAYGVPAKRGMKVEMNGNRGVITSAIHYVFVRFKGYAISRPCHPTHNIKYFNKYGKVIWPVPKPKNIDAVWAVIVDGECDIITKVAHLMVAFEERDVEIDQRRPICGQVFREGWMHSRQNLTNQPKCKRCLKLDTSKGAGAQHNEKA